jgi:predicted nucleotidyltransferase component of viral defense system
MKEQAIAIARTRQDMVDGFNLLREYVQSRILGVMQEAGAMVPLAFMGGTALRFIYGIPRYSEDLDFTRERLTEEFDLRALSGLIERRLQREGYSIRVRINDSRVVVKTMVGFVGLPAGAGLSFHADQVLWVKVEVDTSPPAGADLAVSIVDKFGMLRIQHHDLPSLFAGKVAAVLARKYSKGRDLYDLMWYLTRSSGAQSAGRQSIEPNLVLLANALRQTAPELVTSAEEDWRTAVRRRLARVDWVDARRDVAPFLEQRRDLDLIAAETFEALLGAPGKTPETP